MSQERCETAVRFAAIHARGMQSWLIVQLVSTPGHARPRAHLRDPGGDADADGMLRLPALPRLIGSRGCCACQLLLCAPSLCAGQSSSVRDRLRSCRAVCANRQQLA